MAVVADTHAVVWYLLGSDRLSQAALTTLDATITTGDIIYLSSITLIEIAYLVEKGRLQQEAYDLLYRQLTDPDSGFMLVPIDLEVAEALRRIPRSVVPDMPDRIIVATALRLNLPLVSRDAKIQTAEVMTIW